MAECSDNNTNYNINCSTDQTNLVYPVASLLPIVCSPTPTPTPDIYIERRFQEERDLNIVNDFTIYVSPTPTSTTTPTLTLSPTATPTPTNTREPEAPPPPEPTSTSTPAPTPTPSTIPPLEFHIQFEMQIFTEAKLAINMLTSEFALLHSVEGAWPTEPKKFLFQVVQDTRPAQTQLAYLSSEWNTTWQIWQSFKQPPTSARTGEFSNGKLTYTPSNTWDQSGINVQYNDARSEEVYSSFKGRFDRNVFDYSKAIGGTAAAVLGTGVVLAVSTGVSLQAVAVSLLAAGPVGWIAAGVLAVFSFFGFGRRKKKPPKRKIPQWSPTMKMPYPIPQNLRTVKLVGGRVPNYVREGSLSIEQYPTKENGYLLLIGLKALKVDPLGIARAAANGNFIVNIVISS